jgi:hypothetical protein
MLYQRIYYRNFVFYSLLLFIGIQTKIKTNFFNITHQRRNSHNIIYDFCITIDKEFERRFCVVVLKENKNTNLINKALKNGINTVRNHKIDK